MARPTNKTEFIATLKRKLGSSSVNIDLSQEDFDDIRKMRSNGESLREIQSKYGIGHGSIYKICENEDLEEGHWVVKHRLKEDDLIKIKSMIDNGDTKTSVAHRFNISRPTLDKIIKKQSKNRFDNIC